MDFLVLIIAPWAFLNIMPTSIWKFLGLAGAPILIGLVIAWTYIMLMEISKRSLSPILLDKIFSKRLEKEIENKQIVGKKVPF